MDFYRNRKRATWALVSVFVALGSSCLPMYAESSVDGITSVNQQKRVVTGSVIDAVDGTPVIGANIVLKGTTSGVITDMEGKFSISVNSSKDVLIVSFIGYQTREVPIEDLGVINIKLTSDNEMLDEVVVVGSGTQKKVSVTGSIESIKGSSLRVPNSSLTSSLAGKMAGVIVSTTSGEPGSASDFYIRGVSTFGGRSTPLILLDDVEISKNDLNNIPAETIESFSILKDASATAIYGARGANGVMLITTKKGEENSKAKINITFENAVVMPVNTPKFADGATWMEMYNNAEMNRNPAITKGRFDQSVIDATRNKINPYVYPDVDWYDLIFKDMAMNQRANVNISGGGQRVTYYMSLNVSHDSGLLDTPKYYSFDNNINNMTYNFQNNISYKPTNTTKIDLNMNAQLYNKKGPYNSIDQLFQMTLNTAPIFFPAVFPAEEGDTHVKYGNAFVSGNQLRVNPYAYMATTFKQVDGSTLNVTMRINQELNFITKGLSANALVNFKSWSQANYSRTIEPYYYGVVPNSFNEAAQTYELQRLGSSGDDFISESGLGRSSDRTIAMQFQLNYARRFGVHNVGGMLMYMQRDFKDSVLPNRNQGLSGRFTYDYDQRYLAELNFGYNGTERLAKGKRFEFFPAASIGWVVSNESFFKPLRNVVDNLKLRASYGVVGNDETGTGYGHFLYFDTVKLWNLGFTTGYTNQQLTLYGPNITSYSVQDACWERAYKADVGLDLVLFRDLSVVFDFFHERRNSILMARGSWPYLMGYNATPWSNVGKVNNWGYELSVNYSHSFNKDLSMDFRGNFSYTENKYKYIDEVTSPYPWRTQTGRPIETWRGYYAEGLFKSQEEIDNSPRQDLGSTPMPGDIKYRDLNGDGVINADDEGFFTEFTNLWPRVQYGFGLNVIYKNFDFGVFFNGSAMRKNMLTGIHPFDQSDATYPDKNIFQFIADDYWTENNPDAEYPRLGLSATYTANNTVKSTYWLRNSSFLRFKTLEIGYRFKYGRIYLTGDNIAVFTPFKYWDPELSWYKYPLQRTFNIGLQLNF